MINAVIMEGELSEKPVLLEGKSGPVTEFNLEHSDLTGPQPVRWSWRCKASGALAEMIAERGSKGQRITVKGELVQELMTSGGQSLAVVKLRIQDASLGQLKRGA